MPLPHRRLDEVCAPDDAGRNRGEIVRTRYHCKDRLGQPLRPQARHRLLAAMRTFLRDCQEWNWIEVRLNPDRALLFASLREAQDDLQEAASLYHRILAIREHVYGPKHSRTIETRERLSAVLIALDKNQKVALPGIARPEERG